MSKPKDESLSEYQGFEFKSPLFAYLGDYGSEEVMRSGKLKLESVELGLDPRECAAAGDEEIEKAGSDENRSDY